MQTEHMLIAALDSSNIFSADSLVRVSPYRIDMIAETKESQSRPSAVLAMVPQVCGRTICFSCSVSFVSAFRHFSTPRGTPR